MRGITILAVCMAGGFGCGDVVDNKSDASVNTTADATVSTADAGGQADAAPADASTATNCAAITCDPNATCDDSTGTAECTCNQGYSGNGLMCADVDECATNTDNCHTYAACINTDGGFRCSCQWGLSDTAGDGTNCVRPPNSGVCILRDSFTSIPQFDSAPIGSGYAFKFVPGVNTIAGLRTACTPSDYTELLGAFCVANNTDTQRGVVTIDAAGNWMSSGCDDIGCDYVMCP